jgi:peptidase MA superfamily protein
MGRMTPGSRVRRLAGVIGVAALVLAALFVGPPVASAADLAEFGTPTATSSFVDGLDFRQPVTIDRDVRRVELLLTVANSPGATVIEVDGPTAIGATTLTHHLDATGEFLLSPNTRIVARWRLVAADDASDVLVGPEARITFADDRFTWQTAAGDLVRVHWYEGTEAFGRRALSIGEQAVEDASALLGVTESEPVDFFVYADRDPFYDALGPGTRENVGGAQIPGLRTMFALIPPSEIDDSWVATVVPHELTHLVFETAADNPYHFPPRWLNEGLAVYLSEGYTSSDRALVESAAQSGTLIPIDGLIGQFPTSVDRFFLAYAESVSAVDYLVRIHGRDPMVSLIRSYAGGRTDDEAFTAALGVDMTAFGDAWLAELNAAAPTRYGPQPAPAGPIPGPWLAAPGASQPPASGGTVATTAPSAAPGSGATTDDGIGALVLAIVVAVLAVGLIAIVFAARRRRAVPAAESPTYLPAATAPDLPAAPPTDPGDVS